MIGDSTLGLELKQKLMRNFASRWWSISLNVFSRTRC